MPLGTFRQRFLYTLMYHAAQRMASQKPLSTSATHGKDSPVFKIRLATPEDATAIKHIGSTVFAATFGYSLSSDDLNAYLEDAYSLKSVADDIVTPSKSVCVACDTSNKVLGFATLTEGTIEDCIQTVPAPIELQRLYVDSSAHGKGIGAGLVRYVEAIAREREFKTVWLGVWEYNYTAQKVYEKLGYVKVGDHDFVMGKEVQTDWILVKEL